MKVAVTDYTFDSLDTETAVLAPAGATPSSATTARRHQES